MRLCRVKVLLAIVMAETMHEYQNFENTSKRTVLAHQGDETGVGIPHNAFDGRTVNLCKCLLLLNVI